MANFVYGKAKQAILNGGFNFSSNSFRIALVKDTYTPNQNVDEFLSDIPAIKIAYTTQILPNISNTLGVINSQDFSFSLPANTSFNAAIIYQAGSSNVDSRLLIYIDTAEGLPFTGSQNPVTVSFDWISSVISLWGNNGNAIPKFTRCIH